MMVSLFWIQQQSPSHFEVDNQRLAAGQAEDEVFAAALKAVYPLPYKFAAKLFN
jgi:hypothetical protein